MARDRATIRGITKKSTGLIDITSSASISSETFMVPTSAAMVEPTAAIRMMAAVKGAISLVRVAITIFPIISSILYCLRPIPV